MPVSEPDAEPASGPVSQPAPEPTSRRGRRKRFLGPHDREIARLAIPAFGALVAEPAFLLADSAIVGHLGTTPLAGLAVAGTVLATVVSVFVFLAYGTTAAVARHVGAGDLRSAITTGIDGMWLAVAVGCAAGVLTAALASQTVNLFGTSAAVAEQATTYLRISAAGAPAMLVALATTGVLRGLQDTRTPLAVYTCAAVVNVVLNLLFVYGLGLGIAGSALGTVVTQWAMAIALSGVVLRGARRHDAALRPDRRGIMATAHAGVPLIVRTVTLRVAIVVTTYVASRLGDVPLAAHQVAFTLWTLLAFVLDAIAIAGQAITGRYLGAGDVPGTRGVTRRMIGWGLAIGVVVGILLAVGRPLYVPLFTPDLAVQAALSEVLLVAALLQPISGVVFVLDGVLIGAGDGRYLAYAGLVTLVVFLPLAGLVLALDGGLVALWWAFGAFMAARMATLLWRERGDQWLVTGAGGRRGVTGAGGRPGVTGAGGRLEPT